MTMKHSRNLGAAAAAALATISSPLPAATMAFVPPSNFAKTTPTSPPQTAAAAAARYLEDPTFTPPDIVNDGPISERLCAEAAGMMRRAMVPVSRDVSDDGSVGISFIHWRAEPSAREVNALPLLLVHGFDSSALEYRRLGPRLAALGIDVYCADLLGWGYTQLDGVNDFSARAKVEALEGFWQTVGGGREVVVGGASLGGAAVIEFAAKNLCKTNDVTGGKGGDDGDEGEDGRGVVRGTVLIDAQGFVDGIGPMSFLPAPLARAGIKILKSVPLRDSANQMSYFDPGTYATEDALRTGRMHCLREGWDDGMLGFMQSGGFRPKEKVSRIDVPSLILWGRQDGILDGNEFANKFVDEMPDARLQWIEECGHVPHLEQPDLTAQCIAEFLLSEEMRPSEKNSPSAAIADGILDGLFGFLKN